MNAMAKIDLMFIVFLYIEMKNHGGVLLAVGRFSRGDAQSRA